MSLPFHHRVDTETMQKDLVATFLTLIISKFLYACCLKRRKDEVRFTALHKHHTTKYNTLLGVLFNYVVNVCDYIALMINDWSSVEQWWNDADGGNPKYSEKKKTVQILLCPPQNPRGLTWDPTSDVSYVRPDTELLMAETSCKGVC